MQAISLSPFTQSKSTFFLTETSSSHRSLPHNQTPLTIPSFITGYLDTQIDLTRDRPSWFLPGKALQPPLSLLEVRHCIVHRHMPSLAELKRAVRTALAWLWDWYWTHLESAFNLPTSEATDAALTDVDTSVTAKLQSILKSYVKTRKSEIKSKRAPHLCTAARDALSNYTLRFSPNVTTTPSLATQNTLLTLLVHEKHILPQVKKPGSSMSGAFLIWNPLLLAFCTTNSSVYQTLLDAVLKGMRDDANSAAEREGLCEWAACMLTSGEWVGVRGHERVIRERVLGDCMTELGVWDLRLAERVVGNMGEEGALWRAVLDAERCEKGEEEMVLDDVRSEVETREEAKPRVEVEVETMNVVKTLPVAAAKPLPAPEANQVGEKIRGPQKVVGLWKPKPIGWLPEGWDEDT